MTWLKVTGMIPAEANNAWVSGTVTATPLRAEDEGWADGTRRAVWPIEGVLAGAGTRVEARQGGDFLLPGANIGESAVPPSIELLAELKDQQGRTRRFRSVGKVAASALGEWSLNAPLGSVVVKGQNSGPNSWLETTVADVVAATADARSATAASVIQLADTAQLQAQNNAQAAALQGKIPAATVASIPATAGVYYITTGADASQVWEKVTAGGAATRRPDLEALGSAALGLLAIGTGKNSTDVSAAGGLQTKFAGRIRDYGVIPNDQSKAAWNTAIIQMALNLWAGAALIFGGVLAPDGVCTYHTTRGFLISDYTKITCETPTRLKIADGTPDRTSPGSGGETTQTAFFQGKNATSYATTKGVYGVEITDLMLDTNQPNAKNALLGGIRFIGAQGCRLTRVKVTNQPTQDQPGCFSMFFYCSATSADLCNNIVDNCEATQAPLWYSNLPNNIPAGNANSCISFSSVTGANANGAYDGFTRSTTYILSRNYNNKIINPKTSGGSHGVSFDNAYDCEVSGGTMTDHSHRGIIASPTCDYITIDANTCIDIGSAGIHLANDSRGSKIRGNTVRGVRNGAEGDGIKAYVGCSGNIIEGNHVYDASHHAYRLAHGSSLNTIRGNHAYWTRGRGTPGDAAEAAWQASRGFMLMGYSVLQSGVGGAARMLSQSNQVSGNVAVGFYRGYELMAEPTLQDNAVTFNSLVGNHAENCGTGYYVDPTLSAAKLNNNTFFGNTTKNNDADYSAGFSAYFSKIAASTNLADKPSPLPTPSAAPATPFTITASSTGGSTGGTITGLTANAGSTTGTRRRYYLIYTFTPTTGSVFGDQTVTPTTGFTCEIQSPTALKNSNGAPTYATLMTATTLRVDANSGAVQVRLTADLIG